MCLVILFFLVTILLSFDIIFAFCRCFGVPGGDCSYVGLYQCTGCDTSGVCLNGAGIKTCCGSIAPPPVECDTCYEDKWICCSDTTCSQGCWCLDKTSGNCANFGGYSCGSGCKLRLNCEKCSPSDTGSHCCQDDNLCAGGLGSCVNSDCGADTSCNDKTPENHCPTQGMWCDASCQEIDRDTSQQVCQHSSATCTPYYWSIGGEVAATTCCGDDSGEYRIVCEKKSPEDACDISTDDEACCDSSSDCVYNGNCYKTGYQADIDNDGKIEKCIYSEWWFIEECNSFDRIWGDFETCPYGSECSSYCLNRGSNYPYNSANQYRDYFVFAQSSKCECYVTHDAYIVSVYVNDNIFIPTEKCVDTNENGYVDIFDVRKVAKAYGSAAEDDPNTLWDETEYWDPLVDFDGDGDNDIFDVRAIAKYYGCLTDNCTAIKSGAWCVQADVCGNGRCEDGEDSQNCPEDCG